MRDGMGGPDVTADDPIIQREPGVFPLNETFPVLYHSLVLRPTV
jgi:hypothetical protein